MWVIIGLAGVTCGGKTTLASSLVEKYKSTRRIEVIAADDFFFPKEREGHVRIDGIGINWELNSSIDMDSVHREILVITKDEYPDNGSTVEDSEKVEEINLLIVDGHTILNYPAIFEMCTLKYFFTLSKEDCLQRRTIRKFLKPDKAGYFEKAVWPTHLAHKKAVADQMFSQPYSIVKFVDGLIRPESIGDSVLTDINRLIEVICLYKGDKLSLE